MNEDDETLGEYDFSEGVRGQFFAAYQEGTNVVLLEEDVAKAFSDAESVNRALRLVMELGNIPAHR